MSDQSNDDESVGYGKPPKATRFKKGQSGNPNGRPKGAKGFAASLSREMRSQVVIKERGLELTVSKAEAAAKRLVAKALGGDMPALKMLAAFDADLQVHVEQETAKAAAETAPDLTDEAVLAHFAELVIQEQSSDADAQSNDDLEEDEA